MDLKEIKETPIWSLYQKGLNFQRQIGMIEHTDRNYRMYNGDQWNGAKLGGEEPVQINFIKPIVKYKVSVIHDNLYSIVYSSMNYDNQTFRPQAERYSKMLNGYASRVWERDHMDYKLRRVTKSAAINDEGIVYVDFDKEAMYPVNEIIDKNDIFYGNENDDEIQNQPYILIRRRMPVVNAIEYAKRKGVGGNKLDMILGDTDTSDLGGEAAKRELDDMVTVIFKMYKKEGKVLFSASTRLVEIETDTEMGLTVYPVAHFVWEETKGSARGDGSGEVRYLIPTQIEVNKTEMRRVITVKKQAFPFTVVDVSKISNPEAINTCGGTIYTKGNPVDDVHKIIGTLQPAQMSSDVKLLQDDLINITRELAGAGDVATGQIDPEKASGRAILAVANASRAPMTEQKEACKRFIEDLARIYLEYLIVHSSNGVKMEEKVTDPMTGEEVVQIVNVPQSALEQLKATVKVEVSPKSAYDRYAQEQTIENLLVAGLFQAQRLPELKAYANALDDEAVAPKQKILSIVDNIETEQRKIAMIQAKAQMMQQRAQQFILEDPDAQAEQIANAQMQAHPQVETAVEGEAEIAEEEQEMLRNNGDGI